MRRPVLLAVLALSLGVSSAQAQDEPSPYKIYPVFDTSLTVGALLGTLAFRSLRVEAVPWDGEFIGLEEGLRGRLSMSASAVSDITLITAMVAPFGAFAVSRRDETSAEAAFIYGETIAITLLLNNASKYLVQRPRPFSYGRGAVFRQMRERSGEDAYLSFYSGHSANAFAAAVAGSFLLFMRSGDKTLRWVFSGVEMTLAAMTAGLRVQAGKHFPSDVVVGTLFGVLVGGLVPYLHQADGAELVIRREEWLAMSGGLVLGGVLAALLPFDAEPNGDEDGTKFSLMPMMLPDGAGVALGVRGF